MPMGGEKQRSVAMEQENNSPEKREEDRQQIQQFGAALVEGKQGSIYTLTIIGQVEGHQILPETVTILAEAAEWPEEIKKQSSSAGGGYSR